MRLPKTRRGVSPIIATVLLILIAIATGIVIYAFMAGWIGTRFSTTSGPQAVLVVESGYYNSTYEYFVVYVRNDGSVNTNISRVYITDPSGATVLIKAPTDTISFTSSSDINNEAYVGVINKEYFNPPVDMVPALIPANGTAVKVIIATDNAITIESGVVYTIKLVGTDGSEVTTRIRA